MTAGDLDALGAVLAADARVRFAYVFGVVGGRPIYGRDDVARATAGPSSTSSSTSSPTTTLTSRQCANVLVRDG